MKTINLIFPHQLFQESPLFVDDAWVYLVEEYLFFKQYSFHKQKIAFHRASMKCYADFLQEEKNLQVTYVEAIEEISDIRLLLPELKSRGVEHINYIDPTDTWLQQRLERTAKEQSITTKVYNSPLFLNSKEEVSKYFPKDQKKYQQKSFYMEQRKLRNILMESDGTQPGENGVLMMRTEKNIRLRKRHLPYNFQMQIPIMKKQKLM